MQVARDENVATLVRGNHAATRASKKTICHGEPGGGTIDCSPERAGVKIVVLNNEDSPAETIGPPFASLP
jgi:hypothetical protein